MMQRKITRDDSIQLLITACEIDEYLAEEFWDGEDHSMPDAFEIMEPLGVTREEFDRINSPTK